MDILNLKEALSKLESVGERLLDSRVEPLVEKSIKQLSAEVKSSIEDASKRVEHNVTVLSNEVHNHRSITAEQIRNLIDYSADKFGVMLDQRIALMKAEVSDLINEKTEKVKKELELAAVASRRALYVNAAISFGLAALVAVLSFIYRRTAAGELDPFLVYRVMVAGCGTFTAVLGLLKVIQRWRAMEPVKKGIATVALGYFGVLRPNGAVGLFALSLFFLACWAALQFYTA
ncbi:hypothetical protein [Pseudoduganella sp.]|uniref:hypothetical protein n=1 Tax=Pseudoduganella sp. TaxID=1880898 RepID=UPI0035B0DD7B